MADRYIKLILTVIAVELLWLGVRDAAPRVEAQAQASPMEVVITDVRIGKEQHAGLPVVVMGGARTLTGVRAVQGVEPLVVRVPDPVEARIREAISISQPLTVRTGSEPLVVDVVPGRPSQRPGN